MGLDGGTANSEATSRIGSRPSHVRWARAIAGIIGVASAELEDLDEASDGVERVEERRPADTVDLVGHRDLEPEPLEVCAALVERRAREPGDLRGDVVEALAPCVQHLVEDARRVVQRLDELDERATHEAVHQPVGILARPPAVDRARGLGLHEEPRAGADHLGPACGPRSRGS